MAEVKRLYVPVVISMWSQGGQKNDVALETVGFAHLCGRCDKTHLSFVTTLPNGSLWKFVAYLEPKDAETLGHQLIAPDVIKC